VEIIEQIEEWRRRYADWYNEHGAARTNGDVGESYPFVVNKRAPFTPARRALPMLNLALISSAGAYLDGTQPFNVSDVAGDVSFREIPIEVGPNDLRFAARGYDPAAVQADLNTQLPLEARATSRICGKPDHRSTKSCLLESFRIHSQRR
jgi:hypothetical protein